uniref:Uncharacterized protein n=1 Tax=Cynoglossus semilaevis TaxID=244447 RepID=A0A3P8VGR6_CYNSE
MIQSSQPSSLKFTCSAFLLHLDLDFFPCRLPCRLLSAVLLLRRDLRDLIFSFISPLGWPCPAGTGRSCPAPASKTSHPGLVESSGSRDLESSNRPLVCRGACRSRDPLLNILNSAPTSSSWSERVETSNRYFCLLRGESISGTLFIMAQTNFLILYILLYYGMSFCLKIM